MGFEYFLHLKPFLRPKFQKETLKCPSFPQISPSLLQEENMCKSAKSFVSVASGLLCLVLSINFFNLNYSYLSIWQLESVSFIIFHRWPNDYVLFVQRKVDLPWINGTWFKNVLFCNLFPYNKQGNTILSSFLYTKQKEIPIMLLIQVYCLVLFLHECEGIWLKACCKI